MIISSNMVVTQSQPHQAMAESAPLRLRQRILSASGWAGAGFVLDKVIAVIQLMVLARLLTPVDFGIMAASAVIILACVTISELGLESALIAKTEIAREDLAVAWTIGIVRGVFMASCVWATADVIGDAMQMPQLAGVLRVHAWLLVLQGLNSPAMAILLKNLDLRRRASIDLVRRLIEAAVTITLALWLHNVWALLLGQLVGLVVGSMLSFWVAPFRPCLSLRVQPLIEFLRFGAYVNLTSLLAFGVLSGGEFVVGRMLGSDALGFYTLALAFPIMIGIRAPILMTQVSMPVYSKLRLDQSGTVRAFGLHFGLLILVLFPFGAIMAVAAPDIVRVLGGEKWMAAAEPLRVLSIFSLCSGLSAAIGALQYGLGRPDVPLRVWVGQFLIYAIAIVPLTNWYGLIGAAWALSLSYLCGLGLYVLYTCRQLGGEAWSVFSPLARTLFPLVSGLSLFLFVQEADRNTVPAHWTLLVGTLSAVGMYLLYVWWVEYPRLLKLWQA
jgi:O-antigen/teichoic acid export membrane protein